MHAVEVKDGEKLVQNRRDYAELDPYRLPVEALGSQKGEFYLEKCDVWIFGLFIWEALSLFPTEMESQELVPFDEAKPEGLKRYITSGCLPKTPFRCEKSYDDKLAAALWRKTTETCLIHNDNKRANWSKVSKTLSSLSRPSRKPSTMSQTPPKTSNPSDCFGAKLFYAATIIIAICSFITAIIAISTLLRSRRADCRENRLDLEGEYIAAGN